MQSDRRSFLRYCSAGVAAVIAGCNEQGEVTNPTETDLVSPTSGTRSQGVRSTPQPTETDSPMPTATATPTVTGTSTPQDTVAQLGETLFYTRGDEELAFTVSQASLHDVFNQSRSGTLYSFVPENEDHVFLRMLIEVENKGDERVITPGELVFVMGGTQHEITFRGTSEGRYQPNNELVPDTSTSGWLHFSIPPSGEVGRLIVDFNRFGEAVTGEWVIDSGDLDRATHDYTEMEVGQQVPFGTDSTNYQVGVTDIEETLSYTYTSNGYDFEATADEGNKFVLVSVRAENTGETDASLPSTVDMSLVSGSTQTDESYYRASPAYEGGEVAPGVERQGSIEFEVPETASNYTLRMDLTRHITATWDL